MNLKPLIVGVVGFAIVALGAGCGPKGFSKTKVKITMDGAPVADATVTLVPDSADTTVGASGKTDAQGICELTAPNKPGVAKGSYKVTVVKSESVEADSNDPTKSMQKYFESQQGGKKQPGGGVPGAGGAPEVKSELPIKYAKPDTTDLTLKVPVDGVPELKLQK